MNSFYKRSRFFIAFLSFLYCTSFSSDWSNYPHIQVSRFTYEPSKKDSSNNRIHSDFSHDDTWSNFKDHGSSGNIGDFYSYTKEDFQNLNRCGYEESDLLNQRCLYMYDAFIEYAQTCASYKDVIQKLYAELKNLNLIQKTYRLAKGTYCSGLQDRIAYLHKQLNTAKTIKTSSGSNIAKYEPAVFTEQFAEYKALESTYDAYTPCLAKALNKRSAICHTIERTNKFYNLNSSVKKILSYYGHSLVPFTQCSGNQLQQVIHQESLDILGRIDTLQHDSLLYDHQEALVDFAVAMVDYNHAGLIDKAMTIGDLCWTLLDYGQAIAEGAALGVYSAAHDILTNPIEATVCLVAGKQVLAYQLCKVLYNVADIGATAISDYDCAKEKWNKYAEPLNNIIDAINKKEITARDAIKSGTAFVVGYKAQGKLLGGLGKFCRTIQQKSINFVRNNSLLNPQEYLTTPEGLLFKAVAQSNKFQQSGQSNATSNLNNSVEKLTGTVWKNIKPTDKMYPGTKIPKSFELTVGKEKFWVGPNATKHMRDYIVKRQPAYTMPIDSQILLTAFEAAVKQAVAEGIVWRNEIIVKSWQFGFDLSKKEGLLPTIYHANFNPEGWLPSKKYSKII